MKKHREFNTKILSILLSLTILFSIDNAYGCKIDAGNHGIHR